MQRGLEHSFATCLGINIEINADVGHLANLQQAMPLHIVEIGGGDDDGDDNNGSKVEHWQVRMSIEDYLHIWRKQEDVQDWRG